MRSRRAKIGLLDIPAELICMLVFRSFPASRGPVVQRQLFSTKAAGQETQLVDNKKDLQSDIVFKPFDEVSAALALLVGPDADAWCFASRCICLILFVTEKRNESKQLQLNIYASSSFALHCTAGQG